MSDMERNKGKLIPVNVDTEHFTDEDFETYSENGFMIIDGMIYEVEWEIQRRTDECGFADVTVDEVSGEIHFHTYHYNGGAGLEEVIENQL